MDNYTSKAFAIFDNFNDKFAIFSKVLKRFLAFSRNFCQNLGKLEILGEEAERIYQNLDDKSRKSAIFGNFYKLWANF